MAMRPLLDAGAQIEAMCCMGRTPLLDAASRGHLEAVRLLLSRGAAVDARGNDGANALINASEWGHLGVLRELLARGADANARHNINGDTALHLASWHGYAEVVRELLACGAVVNARADNGLSPLLGACQNGQLEAAALLLGAGADLALLDERGRSALRLAEELVYIDDIDDIPPPSKQRREHKALVQLLRERGAM